jgi:putative ABC transport system permease protein
MKLPSRLRRVLNLVRRREIESDLRQQLEAHLALVEEEERALGSSMEHARRAARLRFGNPLHHKEQALDDVAAMWVEEAVRNTVFAARQLARNPAFVCVSVLSLALGIAASTVVFAFVSSLMMPTIPVQDSDRLVAIYSKTKNHTGQVTEFQPTSYPNAQDYKTLNRVFAHLTVIVDTTAPVEIGSASSQISVNLVDAEFFSVLGVQPELGRVLSADDDAAGAAPVIVISHHAWIEELGGDSAVLGRAVRLNHQLYEIVGVMPDGFRNLGAVPDADVWVPAGWHQQILVGNIREWFDLRVARVATMVARLRPGTSIEQARADLNVIGSQLEQHYPKDNAGRGVMVAPLKDTVVPPAQRNAYLRAGAALSILVAIILLIACANVSNLLLARALRRRREFAIRLSLGASRAQLVRQLLAESLLLSALSGGVGLLGAYWIRSAIMMRLPSQLLAQLSVTLDSRVIWFAIGVSMLSTFIFGLVPALQGSREIGQRPEQIDSHQMRSRTPLMRVLVVAQISLSLVGVALSLLFVRSLYNAQKADLGFDLSDEVVASVDFGTLAFTTERIQGFYARAIDQLSNLETVFAVGVSDTPLLVGSYRRTVFPADVDVTDPSNGRLSGIISVSPGFFRAVRTRFIRGRDFDDHDDLDRPMVAVINETAARMLWPRQDVLGKRLRFLLLDWDVIVVGVVGTVTYQSLGEVPQPIVYLPLKQHPARQGAFYVRTNAKSGAALKDVQAILAGIEPALPPIKIRTGHEVLDQWLMPRRIGAQLLVALGAVGLLLAVLGTYGVMSYATGQRRREIAIRLALGASRFRALRHVLLQGLVTILIGVALGSLLAFVSARAVLGLLYGVSASDNTSLALSSGALALAGFVACGIPALKAVKVDPTAILRSE